MKAILTRIVIPLLVATIFWGRMRYSNACSTCRESLWLWLSCSDAVYIDIFFIFIVLPIGVSIPVILWIYKRRKANNKSSDDKY